MTAQATATDAALMQLLMRCHSDIKAKMARIEQLLVDILQCLNCTLTQILILTVQALNQRMGLMIYVTTKCT